MPFGWFNAREATDLGTALADQFTTRTWAVLAPAGATSSPKLQGKALDEFMQRAAAQLQRLELNFYKKAKFANTFKWRLLEKGVAQQLADQVTNTLVMNLTMSPRAVGAPAATPQADQLTVSSKIQDLMSLGTQALNFGDIEEAITHLQALVALKPRHAEAHVNLGAALMKLGRYAEAEDHFVRAIRVRPNFPEAHANLGSAFRVTGRLEQAEGSLRRALKMKPNDDATRSILGWTLLAQGRVHEAKGQFEKVLKITPRNAEALLGSGQIAAMEGRFGDAEVTLQRVLAMDPNMASALATLAKLRKMTPADSAWLERAKAVAQGTSNPVDEANLRFALGKYFDDVNDFDSAFHNYQRANQLSKAMAGPYRSDAHQSFVDDMIRVYTPELIAEQSAGGSDSMVPVFVAGMPRSGTSLMEQIIASHPAAAGAGEIDFWISAVRQYEGAIRAGQLDAATKSQLGERYLRELATFSSEATRIVDKTPANTEYLGLIHSVFPKARIIYMRRDPIDTCLSCYFQQFSTALTFAMDLGDLAHYQRQFHRVMEHWRAVLPPGTILDVPYEQLVADQETWTRRILEHLGLPWDERCVNFQETRRAVATDSAWQVRQKIYKGSVQRWRNYKKFIGPLNALKDLGS